MAQNSIDNEYHLLIGTYSGEGNTNNVHVYRFNTQSGKICHNASGYRIGERIIPRDQPGDEIYLVSIPILPENVSSAAWRSYLRTQ